jgi:hypothetical protein
VKTQTTGGVQERRYRRKCRNCGCALPMHKLNFCSRQCAQRWQAKEYKRKHKVVVKKLCVVCKQELAGRQAKFCSGQCLQRFHNEARFEDKERDGVCCVCGKPFVIRRGSKTCSPACSKQHRNNIAREFMKKKRAMDKIPESWELEVVNEPKIRTCLRCDKKFESYGNYICPKCTEINSSLCNGVDWHCWTRPRGEYACSA